MKARATVGDGEIGRDFKRGGGFKTLDSGLLEGMRSNWFVELSIVAVGAIHWLKRNKFDGIRGQVSSMLLFDSTSGGSMLKFIRGALQRCADAPGAGKSILQLVHLLLSGV